MTKEIKLRICGMHMHGPDGEQDDVEVVSVGQMCERDGFACITYDEVVEEEENSVKEDESQTTSKDADDNQNKNSSAQDDLPEPTVEPDEEEEPKENVETGTPNPIPTETPELLTPSEE